MFRLVRIQSRFTLAAVKRPAQLQGARRNVYRNLKSKTHVIADKPKHATDGIVGKPRHTQSSQSDHIKRHAARVLLGIGVAGGVFLAVFLEKAPYTGRYRLIFLSDDQVQKVGERECGTLKEAFASRLLPQYHPATHLLRTVGQKVLEGEASREGSTAHKWKWEYFVIDDPTIKNAMVLPGGKVFVFTGLLQLLPTEDALAAVVAHECGHALANHYGEQHSFESMDEVMFYVCLMTGGLAVLMYPFLKIATQLGVVKPKSRSMELEADYIGLQLLASSCHYDPREVVNVLTLLKALHAQEEGFEDPLGKYLATHPDEDVRIQAMMEQMPKAVAEQRARCGNLRAIAPRVKRPGQVKVGPVILL